MKSKDSSWIKDVETLVEQTTVAEATEAVWKHFEKALSQLDTDSLELLREHFNGASVAQLSRKWNLSEAEVDSWLKSKRKELVQHLRAGTQVRQ